MWYRKQEMKRQNMKRDKQEKIVKKASYYDIFVLWYLVRYWELLSIEHHSVSYTLQAYQKKS